MSLKILMTIFHFKSNVVHFPPPLDGDHTRYGGWHFELKDQPSGFKG